MGFFDLKTEKYNSMGIGSIGDFFNKIFDILGNIIDMDDFKLIDNDKEYIIENIERYINKYDDAYIIINCTDEDISYYLHTLDDDSIEKVIDFIKEKYKDVLEGDSMGFFDLKTNEHKSYDDYTDEDIFCVKIEDSNEYNKFKNIMKNFECDGTLRIKPYEYSGVIFVLYKNNKYSIMNGSLSWYKRNKNKFNMISIDEVNDFMKSHSEGTNMGFFDLKTKE